ncbi:MAG TPA: Nif3-like dinuclear metal center hexameric protein [Microscillaceae bacterium]|nr:Nif3-like dinuclear metal center hexameric protein [Microscillaceae bacterium]
MPTIQQVTKYLEEFAPRVYQESYDNSGLIVGDPSAEVTGIIVSLDAIESVIDEAIAKKCNLVVAHHPIVFKGLRKLNGRNYVERTVIKAIKNDIGIYAIHTNLDNVAGGVNFKIAEKLGLENVKVLAPKKQNQMKLTVFVPKENTQAVLNALGKAGAGKIGNYEYCSFRTEGTGTFRGNEAANPAVGAKEQLEEVSEDRIEVIFPAYLEGKVMQALRQTHPYEEIAYYLHALENTNTQVGSGAIGSLTEPLSGEAFLKYLKERMDLQCIRHTKLLDKEIKKVAVCGGTGSFLLPKAMGKGADVFITADYKYHEFFDADGKILIADIGHYESEQYTSELLRDYLTPNFEGLPISITDSSTNPINYFVK